MAEGAVTDSRMSDYPAAWRVGLASLSANRPLQNFPAPWWRGLIRDAERPHDMGKTSGRPRLDDARPVRCSSESAGSPVLVHVGSSCS
jgi:hypothetical protein